MSPHLTIGWISCRKEGMFQWFYDSLRKEIAKENFTDVSVVVVDYHDTVRHGFPTPDFAIKCVKPKPSVWQGEHRLTKESYFGAAGARNTAICLAPDGWFAAIDDLSVLMPGWLSAVHRAMEKDYCVFGAYKKVKRLVVEDGVPVSYEETPGGVDTRWPHGSDNDAIPITNFGTYGCSMAMPVEALLKINGYDERCDCIGLGSEDDMAGLMLRKQGYDLRYDRRMLTLESEERHHWEPPMKRMIETGGQYPDKDASWAILRLVNEGNGVAPNEHFGPGGLRALRDRILTGGSFPPPTGPLTNWYSGRKVREY